MCKKISCNLWGRIIFSILYFLAGILLIIIFKDKIFFVNIDNNDCRIYYRLIWSFAAGLIGFSVYIGYIVVEIYRRNRFNDENPIPTYLIYYPFVILVTSTFSFVSLNIFNEILGTLYYGASLTLSFLFGLYIDNLGRFITIAIKKATK